ncbi:MAG: hypothetical protein OQJ89_12485 [Kangiellaceae bacterium]|nr:hypothetical protein [Kangiellaceae bacterium]MCW9017779.1 hypothetical protein [Kangiellaceae bacterium]
MNSLKYALLALTLAITGCEKAPVVPKNDYEKAVYNEHRPDADRDQDERRKPAAILEFSRVKPGMKVADFQAGGGYYSDVFSHYLGEKGKVFLHNVPKKASRDDIKAKVKKRLANNPLKNIESVQGELNDFVFPAKVDLVLLSKVFHDLYVPEKTSEREQTIEAFFNQLKANLDDSGKVLLIDHSAPSDSGISITSKTHRIDPKFVIEVFRQQGFNLVAQSDALSVAYDDKTLNIWDSKVRNNTDRFILLFEK